MKQIASDINVLTCCRCVLFERGNSTDRLISVRINLMLPQTTIRDYRFSGNPKLDLISWGVVKSYRLHLHQEFGLLNNHQYVEKIFVSVSSATLDKYETHCIFDRLTDVILSEKCCVKQHIVFYFILFIYLIKCIYN